MNKFYFISPASYTSEQMLRDLEKLNKENFVFIKEPINIKNKIIRKLFTAYFNLNAKVNLPFKCIWHKFYSLSKIDFDGDDNYIILGNGVFNYYDYKWLNKLKEKYNLRFIVYYIDPLSGLMSTYMKENIEKLDKEQVYTFDYNDSKTMNCIHSMNFYSKKEISVNSQEQYDVYFVGMNKKNRVEQIHKIWDKLQDKNISCDFNIVGVDDQIQTRHGINYNKPKVYDEVLEDIQNSKCILEVLQPGQTGVTLRYYEAIAYNKKLITNNALIKELPFYDEKYMQVFDNIENIDVDWINNNIEVDYKYNNEFSPINFLKEIELFTAV